MKRIYAFIAALAVIIVGAVMIGQHKSTSAAKPKTVTVGILQTMSHPALDQINKGVVKGLAENGYKVGKNLKIKQLNAEADQSNLKSMSEKLIAGNANLTVGIATPAAMSLAAAANGKTPVVIAGVTDPASSGVINSEKKPGANVTGTSGESPLAKQLAVVQAIKPNAKQVGIIYSPSDHGGTYNAKKFAKLAAAKGLKAKLYTISNSNDVEQTAQQMVHECDVVYAPQDNLVASSMKTLASVANDAKVPVVPAADTMVKDGGTVTYAISQFDLGKLTGKMAANVLKGKKTSTYAIEKVTKGAYVINQKEVKALGLKLPASITKGAKANGEIFK